MRTMKAAVVHAFGELLVIEDLPVPDVRSGQMFSQSLAMLRKRGTMSMVGLPPGDFALPIFDVVLNAKTVRGSIVGTRQDLNEALQFAAEKKVHAETTPHALEDVNVIFDALRQGRIKGRAVLTFD